MKVEFLQTNIINRIKHKKNLFYNIKPKRQNNDIFRKEFIDILNKISRVYSVEDLKLVEKYKKNISKKTNLLELKNMKLEEYLSYINDLTKTPSNKLLNSIRKEGLKLHAINSLLGEVDEKQYSRFFKNSYGIQALKLVDKFYPHPINLAMNLCGIYSKEELNKIQKKQKKYSNYSFSEIMKQKLIILDKLTNKLYSPKADFYGYFSNKDLEKIKNMCIEYEALNNTQLYNLNLKNNVNSPELQYPNTKAIESLAYAKPITNLKIGDYIQGKGLVIDKLMINNNPMALFYSMDDRNHTIKMYDLKKITLKKDLIRKEEILKSDLISLVNKNTEIKNYLDDLNNSIVSEINFKIIDFKKYIKTPNNNFPDSIKNSTEAYFISNFVNYNPKRYKNAGLILGIKLLKTLTEQKDAPIFLTAHAFNNKQKSPYLLYQRLGFKPYSHTTKEINDIANNNNGKIPVDLEIKMYLESIEPLKSKISELEKIYLNPVL